MNKYNGKLKINISPIIKLLEIAIKLLMAIPIVYIYNIVTDIATQETHISYINYNAQIEEKHAIIRSLLMILISNITKLTKLKINYKYNKSINDYNLQINWGDVKYAQIKMFKN